MILLLAAGIGFVLAGLLAIALGIPVKEFSFGNTLILCGAIVTCTGAILLGLSAVVRELRAGRAVAPAVGTPVRVAKHAPPVLAAEPSEPERQDGRPEDGFLFSRDQAAAGHSGGREHEPASPESAPAPWQDETRARPRPAPPPPAEPDVAPPEAVKARRNLLFSSSSRKERERAAASDPALAESAGLADSAAPASADPEAAPATSFDQAWPEPARPRLDPVLPRRRPPPPRGEAAVAESAPPATEAEPAPVTVLKSGVVDGMHYSLYSDGSIEAQMPEGMMRFASIDELRSHLDQRP
jgi:hypothetical protein